MGEVRAQYTQWREHSEIKYSHKISNKELHTKDQINHDISMHIMYAHGFHVVYNKWVWISDVMCTLAE